MTFLIDDTDRVIVNIFQRDETDFGESKRRDGLDNHQKDKTKF